MSTLDESQISVNPRPIAEKRHGDPLQPYSWPLSQAALRRDLRHDLGGTIERLFSSLDVVRRTLPVLGVAEGSVRPDSHGRYVLRKVICGEPSYKPLPDVYKCGLARRDAGRLRGLGLVMWAARLLADAGVLRLPVVVFPGLDDASLEELQLLPLLRGYIGVRLAVKPKEPFPLAYGFLEDWTGLSRAVLSEALTTLKLRNVLVRISDYVGPFGRRPGLFSPGPGVLIRDEAAVV